MCLNTNDQRCGESPRLLIHTEPSNGGELFVVGAPKNAAPLEIMSSVKVRTALRATTTRSIDCARSPFCVNEAKRSRIRVQRSVENVKIRPKPPKNMYPQSSQVASTQNHPKNPRRCTPQATPNTQIPDQGWKIQGQRRNVQLSKCEQRDKAGNVEEEILRRTAEG